MVRASERSGENRASFGAKPMPVLAYRMGVCLASYTQQFNRLNGRSGALFQPKTKALSMTEAMQRDVFKGTRMAYIANQMHYHHQNA
jgi:hypothetical protein